QTAENQQSRPLDSAAVKTAEKPQSAPLKTSGQGWHFIKKCHPSGYLLTVIALLMVLFIHQVAIIYVAVVLVGFGAAGGALQTGLSVVQLFNPGPKGRNTGIYYTFMGIASYLVPVLASRLTIVSGEAAAVYTLMLLMVAFGVLEILSALFLVGQHKKIFGTNPLA
ncbi:MAG: MFS transporter, partial [Anaerotignum sp.]|nr:MFS transporter [Anaerotignum sp.]